MFVVALQNGTARTTEAGQDRNTGAAVQVLSQQSVLFCRRLFLTDLAIARFFSSVTFVIAFLF